MRESIKCRERDLPRLIFCQLTQSQLSLTRLTKASLRACPRLVVCRSHLLGLEYISAQQQLLYDPPCFGTAALPSSRYGEAEEAHH
jgi:hypothetical protein